MGRPPNSSKQCLAQTPAQCTAAGRVLVAFAVLSCLGMEEAFGAPSSPLPPSLARRQSDSTSSDSSNSSGSSNGGISPQVWIPAVIIILVLLAVFCFMWSRKGFLDRLRGVSPTTAATTTPQTRELTADQLTNRSANTSNATGARTRPRRTRRTPSQISTASLPVYMKEPGDQELVIFRGPEDMDDPMRNGIPEAEEQDVDITDSASAEDSISRLYAPANQQASQELPSMSHSTFALIPREDSSGETVIPELSPESQEILLGLGGDEDSNKRESVGAQTLRSEESSDSRTGLMPSQQFSIEIPDEDAPPYTETVHLSPTASGSEHGASSISSPPGSMSTPATSPSSSPPDTTRRSTDVVRRPSVVSNRSVRGLRGLGNLFTFGAHHNASAAQSGSHSSNSTASATATGENLSTLARMPAHNASTVSVSNPPVSGSNRHRRHRSSQSGSTSTINLPLLRAVSRQRSSNTLNGGGAGASSSRLNLTSPSMLSINSISAPLSHTLLRTDIRYPPGGPTPEQIKLISSREGLEKFGVPYGKDAIEHAEASRLDLPLEPPPRVFEDDEEGSTSDEGEPDDGVRQASGSRSETNGRSTRDQDSPSHTTVPQIVVPIFM